MIDFVIMKFAVMHKYKRYSIEPAGFSSICVISDYNGEWARFMGTERKWQDHYSNVTPFKNEKQAHKVVDTL